MPRTRKKYPVEIYLALNKGSLTRQCTKCGEEKSVEEFYVTKRGKKLALYSRCHRCHQIVTEEGREKNPESRDAKIVNLIRWRAEQKGKLREIVNRAKDVPCADCGVVYPHYVMDFDHVRGEKEAHVSRMLSRGVPEEVLLAEIEKCEVVCANCHRERSFGKKFGKEGTSATPC